MVVMNRFIISLGYGSEVKIVLLFRCLDLLIIGCFFFLIRNSVIRKLIISRIVVMKKMVCNFMWLVRKLFNNGLLIMLLICVVESVFNV